MADIDPLKLPKEQSDKLADSFKKLNEVVQDNTEVVQDNTEQEEKSNKLTKTLAKLKLALAAGTEKATGKLERHAESIDGVSDTMEIFGHVVSKDVIKKLTLLTGATGLLIQTTTKYGKVLVDIQRALPGFNNDFIKAITSTGSRMLDTGLSIEQLGEVTIKNGLAFRRYGDQIAKAAGENENLRLSLGLSREAFVDLTAKATMNAAAQGKEVKNAEILRMESAKYITNLSELALQTGRQADEVEQSRISNSQASAGFIATLDKQAAAIFQNAQRELERAGPGFAQQFSSLLSSADFSENLKNIEDFAIAANQVNAEAQLIDQKELDTAMFNLRKAAQDKDADAAAAAFKTLTKFGMAANMSEKALLKMGLPINDATRTILRNAAAQGKITDANNQTTQDAGKAQVEGQKAQLKFLTDLAEQGGETLKALNKLRAAFSAFGGEIGALVTLLGAAGAMGFAGAIGATLIPIAIFGASLLAIAKFIDWATGGGVRQMWHDLMGGGAEQDRAASVAAAAAANKGTIDAIKRARARGDISAEAEKKLLSRVNIEGTEERSLGGFWKDFKSNVLGVGPAPGEPVKQITLPPIQEGKTKTAGKTLQDPGIRQEAQRKRTAPGTPVSLANARERANDNLPGATKQEMQQSGMDTNNNLITILSDIRGLSEIQTRILDNMNQSIRRTADNTGAPNNPAKAALAR